RCAGSSARRSSSPRTTDHRFLRPEQELSVYWLKRERTTMDRLLPGLDEALADLPLMELEEPPTVGLKPFREAGAPGLLVPNDHAGLGATAVEAVQVQRAIGSRAPSV